MSQYRHTDSLWRLVVVVSTLIPSWIVEHSCRYSVHLQKSKNKVDFHREFHTIKALYPYVFIYVSQKNNILRSSMSNLSCYYSWDIFSPEKNNTNSFRTKTIKNMDSRWYDWLLRRTHRWVQGVRTRIQEYRYSIWEKNDRSHQI